jgi:hypothetical protein
MSCEPSKGMHLKFFHSGVAMYFGPFGIHAELTLGLDVGLEGEQESKGHQVLGCRVIVSVQDEIRTRGQLRLPLGQRVLRLCSSFRNIDRPHRKWIAELTFPSRTACWPGDLQQFCESKRRYWWSLTKVLYSRRYQPLGGRAHFFPSRNPTLLSSD